MANYNTELFEEALTTQIRVIQYGKTLNSRSSIVLTSAIRDIRNILNSTPAGLTKGQQAYLFNKVEARLIRLDKALTPVVTNSLVRLGSTIAKREYQNVRRMLPTILPVQSLDVTTIRKVMGELELGGLGTTPEAISGLTQSISRNLKKVVRTAVADGTGMEGIVRAFAGRSSSSIRAKAQRALEAVTRTAVISASSAARNAFAKQNSDIIRSMRWVSTLDTRTSTICQELDGKEFPMDGRRPPAHVNCRSTVTFNLKTSSAMPFEKKLTLSQRASIDGPIQGKVTFPQWLKQKIKSSPESVLKMYGVEKGKRIVAARDPVKIVKGFNDADLKPLTLEEIAERTSKEAVTARVKRFADYLLTGFKGEKPRSLVNIQKDIIKSTYLTKRLRAGLEFAEDFIEKINKVWIFPRVVVDKFKVITTNSSEILRTLNRVTRSGVTAQLRPLVDLIKDTMTTNFKGQIVSLRIGGYLHKVPVEKLGAFLKNLKKNGLLRTKTGQSIDINLILSRAHEIKLGNVRKKFDELLDGKKGASIIVDASKLELMSIQQALKEVTDRFITKLPEGAAWLRPGEFMVKKFRNTVRVYDIRTGKLKAVQTDKRGKTARYYIKDNKGNRIYLDQQTMQDTKLFAVNMGFAVENAVKLLHKQFAGLHNVKIVEMVAKHLELKKYSKVKLHAEIQKALKKL